MRSTQRPTRVCWVWLGTFLACAAWGATEVAGQGTYGSVHGMFGDRQLGQPLTPSPGKFGGGIVTGPAGEFLGRGRTYGMRFPNQPWQYPVGVEKYPGLEPRSFADTIPWGLVPRPLPPRPKQGELPATVEPARLEPIPAEPLPETGPRPEQWLREPSSDGAAVPPPAPSTVDSPPTLSLAPMIQPGIAVQPSATGAQASISEAIGRSPRITRLSPVTVTVEGDTAILRGRVATNHDRLVAEQLARFEPGVWQVRNELTVAEPLRISRSNAAR